MDFRRVPDQHRARGPAQIRHSAGRGKRCRNGGSDCSSNRRAPLLTRQRGSFTKVSGSSRPQRRTGTTAFDSQCRSERAVVFAAAAGAGATAITAAAVPAAGGAATVPTATGTATVPTSAATGPTGAATVCCASRRPRRASATGNFLLGTMQTLVDSLLNYFFSLQKLGTFCSFLPANYP